MKTERHINKSRCEGKFIYGKSLIMKYMGTFILAISAQWMFNPIAQAQEQSQ